MDINEINAFRKELEDSSSTKTVMVREIDLSGENLSGKTLCRFHFILEIKLDSLSFFIKKPLAS